MPTNKNALTRYKYLDELLSDRHHFFDIHDLTDRVNEKLITSGLPEVTQRRIEKDINYLEYDPFFAEIERFRVAAEGVFDMLTLRFPYSRRNCQKRKVTLF